MSKESKTLIIALVFSVAFHVFLLLYSRSYTERKKAALAELREVELLEEKVGPRLNPKVLKMMAHKEAEKREESQKETKDVIPSLLQTKKTLKLGVENVEGPKISMEKSIEEPQIEGPSISLDKSSIMEQGVDNAKIDLSSTSLNAEVEGADVVLAFSGKGKSTAEILKEEPVGGSISLDKGKISDVGEGAYLGGSKKLGGGRIKLVSSGENSLKDIEQESPTISSAVRKRPSINLNKGKSSNKNKRPLLSLSGPLKNRKIVKRITPLYPKEALREGEEGTCVLKFCVLKDGRVEPNILILRSTGYPDLDRSAVKALRNWIFEPSTKDEECGILTVVFQLL